MEKFKNFWSKSVANKVIVIFAGLIIISIIFAAFGGTEDGTKNNSGNKKAVVDMVSFSEMTQAEIDIWCESKKIDCQISEQYSDSVEKGKLVSQSVEADKKIYEGDRVKVIISMGKEPSVEYKNALNKAESYSKNMHMSKQGIYDQLVSPYGEKFTKDAAQYAMDNIKADWKANALAKAKSYQKAVKMSKQGIYDQLISQYGEKFTKEEAQYAIDNLDK